MSQVKNTPHVVVWEWQNQVGRWQSYSPEVTQLLERAFTKNLKSVILGDAEPRFKNFCIIMSDMVQVCQVTGTKVNVRRYFYPHTSPAGQGASWQWAGSIDGEWYTYEMPLQCHIEESWTTGAKYLNLNNGKFPYIIDFCNLVQVNTETKESRAIRRIQLAAYPRVKLPNQFKISQGMTDSLVDTKNLMKQDATSNMSSYSLLDENSFGPKPFLPPVPYPRSLVSYVALKNNYKRCDSELSKDDESLSCESHLSHRRPSSDTVSTYLSQDDLSSIYACSYRNGADDENFVALCDTTDSYSDEVFISTLKK